MAGEVSGTVSEEVEACVSWESRGWEGGAVVEGKGGLISFGSRRLCFFAERGSPGRGGGSGFGRLENEGVGGWFMAARESLERRRRRISL